MTLDQSPVKNGLHISEGFLLLITDISDRKAAELDLAASHNRLEEEVKARTAELESTRDFLEVVFNTISQALLVVDTDGRIIRCNAEFYRFFHYQTSEFQNKFMDMLFTEEELHRLKEKIEELKENGHISLEGSVLFNGGEESPVAITTSVLADKHQDGVKEQLLIAISDISQRKKAENRLIESQRIARMIIENIGESILVLQDGLIKYFVNQKFTGHTFEEVKDQPFEQYVRPEHRSIVRENYRKWRNDSYEEPAYYQIQIANAAGEFVWTEVNVVKIKWEKQDGMLVYLRDINRQKEAEERLTENEKLFRAFIDQANDFIMIKDRAGRYVKINKKFSWLIGRSEDEIAGKTPADLDYSQAFIEEVSSIDRQIVATKNTIVRESRARKSHKEGLEWLEETMFPILDDAGEVKFIGVISRDISEAKKAKEELSVQNEELQTAYKKLQESYEIIISQEKLASLGTLAAGIAHEINNPSQAIKFSMQSLRLNIVDLEKFLAICQNIREKESEECPKMLAAIADAIDQLDLQTVLAELEQIADDNEKSVERINNIIQSTSRLCYQEQEMKPCDIRQVVNDALTLLHNNLKYQLQVEKEFGLQIPPIMGIHQQLEQVVINLINNARDAMLEKGLNQQQAKLRIRLNYLSTCNMVELQIADNGCGIPAEALSKIYDPFFTTKPLGKGTGLGLNLVHRIISAHQGTVSADSKAGEGTTFIIQLPAA